MSTMTSSGRSSRTNATSCGASPAWPTTSNPERSSRLARPSRRRTSSSATTTRVRVSVTLMIMVRGRSNEREFHLHGRSRPPWAVEKEPAAQGLHPVLEAGQTRAAGGAGAAGAVVVNGDAQRVAGHLHLYADGRGPGVFGCVGQRLGHHVVAAHFD